MEVGGGATVGVPDEPGGDPAFPEGVQAATVPLTRPAELSQVLQLQREWMRAVVSSGGWYTLGELASPSHVFQLVWLAGPTRTLRTARSASQEHVVEAGVLRYFQLQDEQAAESEPRLTVARLSAQVEILDLLKLASFRTWRGTLRAWRSVPGGGAGAVRLAEPSQPEPTSGPQGLLAEATPRVLLLEALARRGWRCADDAHAAGAQSHPGPTRLSRRLRFSRPYLQACLF